MEPSGADAALQPQPSNNKRNLWKTMRSGMRGTRTFAAGSAIAQSPLFNGASPEGKQALARITIVRNQAEAAERELQDLAQAAEQFTSALRRTQETMRNMLDDHDVQSLIGTPCFYAIHDAHESLIGLVQGAAQQAQLTLGTFRQQIDPAVSKAEESCARMQDAFSRREQLATTVDSLSKTSNLSSQMKAVQSNNEHREAAAAFAQYQTDTVSAVRTLCADVRATLAGALVQAVASESRDVASASKSLRVAADLAAVAPVPKAGAGAASGTAAGGEGTGHGLLSPLEATAAALPRPGSSRFGSFSIDSAPSSAGVGVGVGGAGGIVQALMGRAVLAKVPADSLLALDCTPMLPGESLVSRVEQVVDPTRGLPGVLVTTNYRLRWFPAGCTGGQQAAAAEAQGMAALVGGARTRAQSLFDVSSLTTTVMDEDGLDMTLGGGMHGSGAGAGTAVEGAGQAQRRGHTLYTPSPYLSIPLLSIARMDTVGGPRGSLVLGCTDMRVITLSFTLADADPDMTMGLMADHVWVKDPVFPAVYAAAMKAAAGGMSPSRSLANAWSLYDVRREFDRCVAASQVAPSALRVAVTALNQGFKLCGTYPEALILPSALTDANVAAACKYRSKNRLPAVTWFRASVTLSRSSQPMAGMFSARSSEDEKLVQALASVAADVTPTVSRSCGLAIFDARPRLNAAANAAKGGGTETIGNYPGCTLDFLNIDNIHVVRDALAGLRGHVLRETRYALHAQLEAAHSAAVADVLGPGVGGGMFDFGDYSAIVGVDMRGDVTNSLDLAASGIGRTLSVADVDDMESSTARSVPFGYASHASGYGPGGGGGGGGGGLPPPAGMAGSTSSLLGSPPATGSHLLGMSMASESGLAGLASLDDDDGEEEEAGEGDDESGTSADEEEQTGAGAGEAGKRGSVVDYTGPSGYTTAAAPPLSPRLRHRASSGGVLPDGAFSLASAAHHGAHVVNSAPLTPTHLPPSSSDAARRERIRAMGGLGQGATPASPAHGQGQSGQGLGLGPGVGQAQGQEDAQGAAHVTVDPSAQHGVQDAAHAGTPNAHVHEHGHGPHGHHHHHGHGGHAMVPHPLSIPPTPTHVHAPVHAHSQQSLAVAEKQKKKGRAATALSSLFASTKRLLKFRRKPNKGSDSASVGSVVPHAGHGPLDSPGVSADGILLSHGAPRLRASGSFAEANPTAAMQRRGTESHIVGVVDRGREGQLGRSSRGAGATSAPRVLPWLKLASIQLEGGVRLAKKLLAGTSVLVHCSDGWDRTSALTSLAQLMIDPHARTLEGFAVLIEKEWVSFGHRFGRRNGTGGVGHDRADAGDGQRAPIFVQWLDCVWQMVRQTPGAYEFNEALLVALAEHAYSGRFGNFLYDCERDRQAAKLRDTTLSFWSHVLAEDIKAQYVNAGFVPRVPAPVGGAGAGTSDASTTTAAEAMGLAPVIPTTDLSALAVWPYWTVKWAAT